MCQSGSRSKFIKDKYFSHYKNIKVSKNLQFKHLNKGKQLVELTDHEHIETSVLGNGQFNLYSITRIIQLLLGSIMVLMAGYTYLMIYKNKKYNTAPLIILILFGIMSLINGVTSTCTMSNLFVDYLN